MKSLIDGKLQGLTKYTITDPMRLSRQLEDIRGLGVAFDQEEIDEGTSALGAPIFNHEQIPVAAVVVAGPSQRVTWKRDSEMISALKDTAAKISAQLYYKKERPEVREQRESRAV